MLKKSDVEKKLYKDKTIANLNTFLENLREKILIDIMLTDINGLKITNLDSWLDLKWNLLQYFVDKNQDNLKYASCKNFFKNETNKSKMSSIIIINKDFNRSKACFAFLGAYFFKSNENKIDIDIQEIYGKLASNRPVKLEVGHDFIKFCKGMYRWSQPDLDIKNLCGNSLFQKAINWFFKEDQREQVIYIFNHINRIECNDREFIEVKKILLRLKLEYGSNKQLKFVEKGKIVEKNENNSLNKEIENSQRTGQTKNPYKAPAIIGIFLPIFPSIVFVVNVACDNKYKFGMTDILFIIVGLIPIVSTVVFGILAYNCNSIIDNDKQKSINSKSSDKSENENEEKNHGNDIKNGNSDPEFSNYECLEKINHKDTRP